jgi:hypothetical protein
LNARTVAPVHLDPSHQVFLTPSFLVGRLPIWERVGMTIGLGNQVAATDKPTSYHNFMVSVRVPF